MVSLTSSNGVSCCAASITTNCTGNVTDVRNGSQLTFYIEPDARILRPARPDTRPHADVAVLPHQTHPPSRQQASGLIRVAATAAENTTAYASTNCSTTSHSRSRRRLPPIGGTRISLPAGVLSEASPSRTCTGPTTRPIRSWKRGVVDDGAGAALALGGGGRGFLTRGGVAADESSTSNTSAPAVVEATSTPTTGTTVRTRSSRKRFFDRFGPGDHQRQQLVLDGPPVAVERLGQHVEVAESEG